MMLEMCNLDKWFYIENDMCRYNKEKCTGAVRLILGILDL